MMTKKQSANRTHALNKRQKKKEKERKGLNHNFTHFEFSLMVSFPLYFGAWEHFMICNTRSSKGHHFWATVAVLWLAPLAATPAQAVETNTPTSYERGIAHFHKKEWEKAIPCFSEEIRVNPTNTLAYEYRGGAFFLSSDFDKAIEDFSTVIAMCKTNACAYMNRGSAYRAKKEYSKGLEDLTQSLKYDPRNVLALQSRGACYERLNQFENAILDFNEALRIDPTNKHVALMRTRGYCFERTSSFREAMQDYREAVRIDPTDAEALNCLSWLCATTPLDSERDSKQAVAAGISVCEMSHWKVWQYTDTLAAAYAEAGDFPKAIELQEQALKLCDSKADHELLTARLALYMNRKPYRISTGKEKNPK